MAPVEVVKKRCSIFIHFGFFVCLAVNFCCFREFYESFSHKIFHLFILNDIKMNSQRLGWWYSIKIFSSQFNSISTPSQPLIILHLRENQNSRKSSSLRVIDIFHLSFALSLWGNFCFIIFDTFVFYTSLINKVSFNGSSVLKKGNGEGRLNTTWHLSVNS